jgi:hypothetical protein
LEPKNEAKMDTQIDFGIEIQAAADNHCKRRGETVEAAFLAKVCDLGFNVAKPWGESDPYDFIVNAGHSFQRVQVKSASAYKSKQYLVRAQGDATIYTKENIDFLAAYLVPERLWYVLPVEAFAPRTSLHFNPHGAALGMFEKFREAWCILASAASNLFHAIPQTCRNRELPIRCAVCPERGSIPGLAKPTRPGAP